jgi:O-antigen/teichoic acid export membrane protein
MSASTQPIAQPIAEPPPGQTHDETSRQIRGSSLLLAGRLLAVALNFAVQVLVVRALTKTQYGAFEYALAFVAVGESVVTLGMDRAVSRFLPIYQEQGDYPRFFGTMMLMARTVLTLGVAVLLAVYGLAACGGGHALVGDPNAAALLLIMIMLAPLQAVDNLLIALFAVFASPRAIFFRKHLLGPVLRLAAVLLCVVIGGGPAWLAWGYVAAGALGMALCIGILARALRDRIDFTRYDRAAMRIPAREVFTFAIPLLTTDLAYTLMNVTDTVLLGRFHDTAAVAAFRAVQPAAKLNQLALASFGLLFTPLAARLFARRDWPALDQLYWRTAVWLAVLSFPIFAATGALAEPATSLLYGRRYADSGPILAILAAAYYFNAALGANGTLLMVYGKVRYLVAMNVCVVAVNAVAAALLIPHYGALGAAFATGGALALHNVLKQMGLALCTGITPFDRSRLGTYAGIAAMALGLLALARYVHDAAILALCAAVASILTVWLNRRSLDVARTFPGMARLTASFGLLKSPRQ